MLQVMRPSTRGRVIPKESVCEVRTQDPENFDEEVLALVSAWCHAYPYGRGDLWRSVTLGRAVTVSPSPTVT